MSKDREICETALDGFTRFDVDGFESGYDINESADGEWIYYEDVSSKVTELLDEIDRLRKRNDLLTDHYECKMHDKDRATKLEDGINRLRAERDAERRHNDTLTKLRDEERRDKDEARRIACEERAWREMGVLCRYEDKNPNEGQFLRSIAEQVFGWNCFDGEEGGE
jgi:hypothetical protein